MAWYYDNYGEPIYVNNGDSRFNRTGICYRDPAPVTFRTPPFYSDVYYDCRSSRDQYPDFSYGGELVPVREQVRIRREDPHPYPYPPPPPSALRWLDRDYPPCGGYREEKSYLEFFAPELYSVWRRRKVVKALKAFPGVLNVLTDVWNEKVVVVGNGLCEKQVLRRLQLVPHMERSVFWRNWRCS